jgi:hypothetical protein
MSKATQTFEYLVGKTGRIYVARNGTVTVYVLSNGETWLHHNGSVNSVIFADPAPAFWQGEAKEGHRYQYLTMQMERDSDNNPSYLTSND